MGFDCLPLASASGSEDVSSLGFSPMAMKASLFALGIGLYLMEFRLKPKEKGYFPLAEASGNVRARAI